MSYKIIFSEGGTSPSDFKFLSYMDSEDNDSFYGSEFENEAKIYESTEQARNDINRIMTGYRGAENYKFKIIDESGKTVGWYGEGEGFLTFSHNYDKSAKKMKKSDNWYELTEKLYKSLEGFINRGEFGSTYAMRVERTTSGGVELNVWQIGGHDIELKFEIFIAKDDFADIFNHEESGFIVNIYRTINGNESRYVSNERVEGGFKGLASYIRQYVDDMHTYGDSHVPNTYDGNTSAYDMPEEFYASTKKSYIPDYHDFRTMLTNMKVTKDNRTVFKR